MLSAYACRPTLSRLHVICAAVLALIYPVSASGQHLDHRVVAGVGMDTRLYDGSKYVPGYVGHIGLEIRKRESRGAFRMSVMHYDQQRTDPYGGPCSSTEICELKTSNGVTGMNVDGTFDLGRGTFRPYLLSGAGIYRSRRTTYGDRTCLATCVSILYAWQQPSERIDASAGFHSGIGLTGKLGKTPVFAEMRVLLLASDPARARGMLPLTFGVKF